MSAPGDSTWPEEHMLMTSRDDVPFFPVQFEHDSFAKPQESLMHIGSKPNSYDSLPSSISTSLFEVASNDSSVFGGSIINDGQTSSSISSSRTGTRQDSFSDVHSRKASLSSTHDGSSLNQPAQSPEIADASFLTNFPPNWSSQAKQPYAYQHSRNSGDANASGVLSSTSFYTSHHEAPAEGSQGRTPSIAYPTPMHVMMHSDAYNSHEKSTGMFPPLAPALHTSQQPGTASRGPVTDLSIPGRSNGGKSRSSTSGSTRRAKYRRSRTGCMVCRKRKVKCDQDGQPCRQCRIGKRDCHYEENPPKRKRKSKAEGEAQENRPASMESTETASNDNMTSESVSEILSPNSALALSTLQAEMEKSRKDGSGEDSAGSFAVDSSPSYEETEEELQRKADALFAQHTNLHDVGGEVEDDADEVLAGEGKDSISDIKTVASDSTRTDTEVSEDRRMTVSTTAVTTGTSTTSTMDDSSFEATFADLTHHHSLPGHGAWKPDDGIGSPFTKYVGLSGDDCIDDSPALGVSPANEALPW